jgi:hypothetical protein
MLQGPVELCTVAVLVPKAGQFGVGGISDPRQHFQREQPVLLLRAQLPGEIEDVVVEGSGVAVTEGESDHLTGRPTSAAIVDVDAFPGRGPSDLAQGLGNEARGRRTQRVEETRGGVIVERTGTPSAHRRRM